MRGRSWRSWLAGWHLHHGTFWMVQWQLDGWASFGVHLDLKHRIKSADPHAGQSYGPYMDIHFFIVIVSVGWRPYLSSEAGRLAIGRGGL